LRLVPGQRDHQDLALILLWIGLLWFGLKLGLKMIYRIGMLWILIPVAPLALSCWAIPQAQWIARTWTRQFVGWTFGQVLVTIALKLAFVMNPYGPVGPSWFGVLFTLVMLAMAHDAVDLLVSGGAQPLGAARGMVVSVRRAASLVSGAIAEASAEASAKAAEAAAMKEYIPAEWRTERT
jgi:hypothetical protein